MDAAGVLPAFAGIACHDAGPGGRSGQGREDAPPDAELTVSDRSSN
jgi:hypothetical protein